MVAQERWSEWTELSKWTVHSPLFSRVFFPVRSISSFSRHLECHVWGEYWGRVQKLVMGWGEVGAGTEEEGGEKGV